MMEPTVGMNWAFLMLLGGVALVTLVVITIGVLLVVVARRRKSEAGQEGSAESLADTALQAHQRLEKIGSQVERLEDVLMDELKQE